jgi:hypothetical protein
MAALTSATTRPLGEVFVLAIEDVVHIPAPAAQPQIRDQANQDKPSVSNS